MSTSKPALQVSQQIDLLKSRGIIFSDEGLAQHYLYNISYYRLKGYWWDLQSDYSKHTFKPDTQFDHIILRYDFDRHLRLILFDAIERVEIALRTKMIYHLSLDYGPEWYKDNQIFANDLFHQQQLDKLFKEYGYSQEIFIKDHKKRYGDRDPESWKIMELSLIHI